MKMYYLSIPFAGVLQMAVPAEGEDDARALALHHPLRFTVAYDDGQDGAADPFGTEISEVDTYEHLGQGNVCYAPQNSISVDEVEDMDGDDGGEDL